MVRTLYCFAVFFLHNMALKRSRGMGQMGDWSTRSATWIDLLFVVGMLIWVAGFAVVTIVIYKNKSRWGRPMKKVFAAMAVLGLLVVCTAFLVHEDYMVEVLSFGLTVVISAIIGFFMCGKVISKKYNKKAEATVIHAEQKSVVAGRFKVTFSFQTEQGQTITLTKNATVERAAFSGLEKGALLNVLYRESNPRNAIVVENTDDTGL